MTAKSEHSEQAAVIDWCRRMSVQYPELDLIFAIPNGGALTSRIDRRGRRYSPQAAKLKAEGLRAGVPDLFLPVPIRYWHGLFIEMKLPGRVASREQENFITAMRHRGYDAVVCYSADDAIARIKDYLRI